MLVDTTNLVTEDEFRDKLDRHFDRIAAGEGPVVVTRDAKVVGVFIGLDDYETLVGTAVRDLLASRMKGPTVSHDQVRRSVQEVVRRRRNP